MFDEMEEIDRSDDGKIRLFRVGPSTNDEIPDTPEVKACKRLYGYFVKSERCCNCNYWEYDGDSWGHIRNTWCNYIAKKCNVEKPYASRDGWCEKWAPNCTVEQWKSKYHYNGYQIMYIGGRANPHPRPTEEYNCTTCPAHYNEYDPEKYPGLAKFKRCRVAEEDTGYRRLMTTAKDVCELHPETERVRQIRETDLKAKRKAP